MKPFSIEMDCDLTTSEGNQTPKQLTGKAGCLPFVFGMCLDTFLKDLFDPCFGLEGLVVFSGPGI